MATNTRVATTIAARYLPHGGAMEAFYLDGKLNGQREEHFADLTIDRTDRGSFYAIYASAHGKPNPADGEDGNRQILEKILHNIKQNHRQHIDLAINELAEGAVQVAGRLTISDKRQTQPYFAGILVKDGEMTSVTMSRGCTYLYRDEALFPLTETDYPLEPVDTYGNRLSNLNIYEAGVAGTIRYSNILQLRPDDCIVLCNVELMETIGQKRMLELMDQAEDQCDAAGLIMSDAVKKNPHTSFQLMIGFLEEVTPLDRVGRNTIAKGLNVRDTLGRGLNMKNGPVSLNKAPRTTGALSPAERAQIAAAVSGIQSTQGGMSAQISRNDFKKVVEAEQRLLTKNEQSAPVSDITEYDKSLEEQLVEEPMDQIDTEMPYLDAHSTENKSDLLETMKPLQEPDNNQKLSDELGAVVCEPLKEQLSWKSEGPNQQTDLHKMDTEKDWEEIDLGKIRQVEIIDPSTVDAAVEKENEVVHAVETNPTYHEPVKENEMQIEQVDAVDETGFATPFEDSTPDWAKEANDQPYFVEGPTLVNEVAEPNFLSDQAYQPEEVLYDQSTDPTYGFGQMQNEQVYVAPSGYSSKDTWDFDSDREPTEAELYAAMSRRKQMSQNLNDPYDKPFIDDGFVFEQTNWDQMEDNYGVEKSSVSSPKQKKKRGDMTSSSKGSTIVLFVLLAIVIILIVFVLLTMFKPKVVENRHVDTDVKMNTSNSMNLKNKQILSNPSIKKKIIDQVTDPSSKFVLKTKRSTPHTTTTTETTTESTEQTTTSTTKAKATDTNNQAGGSNQVKLYTIKKGDNMWKIVTSQYPKADPIKKMDEIAKLNGYSSPQAMNLLPGEKIKLN